jgi:hypothetical protein
MLLFFRTYLTKNFFKHTVYKNNATGETQDLLLQHPKLTSDAIPTIFNKLPSYLLTVLPTKRISPETRRKETQKRHAEDIEQFLKNDIIHNYDDFLKIFPNTFKKIFQHGISKSVVV